LRLRSFQRQKPTRGADPPGSKNVANWQTQFFFGRNLPLHSFLRPGMSLPTVATTWQTGKVILADQAREVVQLHNVKTFLTPSSYLRSYLFRQRLREAAGLGSQRKLHHWILSPAHRAITLLWNSINIAARQRDSHASARSRRSIRYSEILTAHSLLRLRAAGHSVCAPGAR
jgi:hypothetical protein